MNRIAKVLISCLGTLMIGGCSADVSKYAEQGPVFAGLCFDALKTGNAASLSENLDPAVHRNDVDRTLALINKQIGKIESTGQQTTNQLPYKVLGNAADYQGSFTRPFKGRKGQVPISIFLYHQKGGWFIQQIQVNSASAKATSADVVAAKRFVDRIVPELTKEWSQEVLLENSDQQFKRELQPAAAQTAWAGTCKILGPLKQYRGSKYENSDYENGWLACNFLASGQFKNELADMKVVAVKNGSEWKIHRLDVEPSASNRAHE